MIPFIDLKAQYEKIKSQIDLSITNVLDSGQYIMGPQIEKLENDLGNFTRSKHVFGVSSGTDALLIALMACDIKAGDEVIIPDFSFFATAEVVSLLGAVPVFCDVERETCNINTNLIENLITSKTKAIMPVSLYGQAADMDEINSIAKKHNLIVIEDACQSFGAIYKNKKSCNISDIGCTSFFPSKPLGCYGDGGAIFTNSDELALKIKTIRNHGQASRYNHTMLGINGRLDTLQAAILIEKLNIFETEMSERQRVANVYTSELREKYNVPIIKEHNVSAWAQYTIQVENREKLVNYLNNFSIPTACHYPKPISKQPYYNLSCQCPVSENLSNLVLSLPMSPYLKESDQNFIIEKLLKF